MLQFQAVGRLGKDPSMQYTPSGTAVTNFSVAVKTGYGEKEVTAWVRLSCFGKLAETANKYLQKGSRIYFVAEYTPDKTGNPRVYQGQSGDWASSFDGKMTYMEFLSDIAKNDSLDVEPELEF